MQFQEGTKFYVKAGANKFGFRVCPFCRHEGVTHPRSNEDKFMQFNDELSAVEYRISGLCQPCQDKTFVEPEE